MPTVPPVSRKLLTQTQTRAATYREPAVVAGATAASAVSSHSRRTVSPKSRQKSARATAARDGMSSSGGVDRAALGYAVGNVSSSVSLVLINKWVFNGGFMFPMTLTFFHFCFTVFFYRGLAAAGLFEPKSMPASEAFKMAAAGVGSIGFMNISLHLNSVGFYQITKLSIVPMTLAAQAVLFGVSTSTKIKLSLLVLILGLGIATVTDVQLNAPGFVIGILAVLTTTIFQLWQGSKQKEYELSGVQLQSAVSFWQAAQSLAAAIALENLCVKSLPWEGDDVSRECNTAVAYISDVETHGPTLLLVSLTCVIALAVNGCSFGLIGRTSAITFQVVGHTKTCLVLAGGFIIWPTNDVQQMINNAIGVGVAFVGCVLYGHVKLSESSQKLDVFDRCCPASVQPWLSPHKYVLVEKEADAEGAVSGEGGASKSIEMGSTLARRTAGDTPTSSKGHGS